MKKRHLTGQEAQLIRQPHAAHLQKNRHGKRLSLQCFKIFFLAMQTSLSMYLEPPKSLLEVSLNLIITR